MKKHVIKLDPETLKTFRKLIIIHKSTGQGLMDLITIQSREIKDHLYKLQELGLVTRDKLTNGSLGVSESNYAWFPTKGYTLLNDRYFNDGSHPMSGLDYVREYLDIDPDNMFKGVREHIKDNGTYDKWKEANIDLLKEMDNLSVTDFNIALSNKGSYNESEVIGYIKESKYYEKNESVGDIITDCEETLSLLEKSVDILNQLLKLGSTEFQGESIQDMIKNDSKMIIENESIISFLSNKELSCRIQDLV